MASILSTAYPDKAPHFFAYLRTITKASRTFEGYAWASYDMSFRRQAANRGSLDWGVVDAALYNEAFAGRAKLIPRCRYCLADTHASPDCVHAPVDSAHRGQQARNSAPRSTGPTGRPASTEICRLFNAAGGSRCKFAHCRYAHLCARCKRPHPSSECMEGRRHPVPANPPAAGGNGGQPTA